MHVACGRGHFDAVVQLLSYGANIAAKDIKVQRKTRRRTRRRRRRRRLRAEERKAKRDKKKGER